jgi:preprotein translocase subunit Sec63
MSSTEEQLISFFAYSMLIYPITSYLISSKRGYSRWKGAIYAVLFLSIIFLIQILYENKEKGPNHYQLMNVARYDSNTVVKRAYKRLSLELHPDKNKALDAQEQFQRVKTAYDVLSNTELRSTYNRMGDAGVKINMKAVIDLRHIVLQLIVYYGSSAIFAFLMTVSEPSGEAMEWSFIGLSGTKN